MLIPYLPCRLSLTHGVTLWILGLLLSADAFAVSTTTPLPSTIYFRNVLANQDIAVGEVEGLYQDHQGFMWLGGRNMLLRYDGYDFVTVPVARFPDGTGVSNSINQVLEIIEDRKHRLWVATRSGLYRYDRERELLLPVPMPDGTIYRNGAVNALAVADDGRLLVGSANGLTLLNPDTSAFIHLSQTNNMMPSSLVNDIMMDNDGTAWLGLEAGLAQLNLTTHQLLLFIPNPNNPESSFENNIRTLAIDPTGYVWAGSDNGIYRLNRTTKTFDHFAHDPHDPETLGNNFTRQIVIDSQGWVWTGSDGAGLALFNPDNNKWIRYESGDAGSGRLASTTVRRIYQDKMGDMWIGTYPSGTYLYDRSTAAIRVFKKSPDLTRGLRDNNVEALIEDNEGTLWIGSAGIATFNPETEHFSHYIHDNTPTSALPTSSILSGFKDASGDLWFTTWGNGVLGYDRKTDSFYSLPSDPDIAKGAARKGDKLNDLMVWGITQGADNTYWLSTHFNGLTHYDPSTGEFRYYPRIEGDTSSLSAPVAWVTLEDSKQRVWTGTAYGLNLLDRATGTFTQYLPEANNPNSLSNGSILALFEDAEKRLWIGSDMGLHRYREATNDFEQIGAKEGFADLGIRAINQDNDGFLWLGTNNGIVRYHPDKKIVKNFMRFNGQLIGGVATGSSVKTRDGNIVFGTRNGLFMFDPDQLQDHTPQAAPNIVLTEFRLFNEKVVAGSSDGILSSAINQTGKIVLTHKQSMISVSFAALNYREPEKNLYAYKLEGFDSEWRELGTARTAIYTNLPAGKFTFKVRAMNSEGAWETAERQIALQVLPPPWKSWWAYTIYGLLCIAAITGFIHSQRRKVRIAEAANHALEEKVRERTAELKGKNAELEEAYQQLEKISLSDPLTGLSNRRYLQKLMPMDTAKSQRGYRTSSEHELRKIPTPDLTFFIMDIDHFKSVNDIYGHAAGDQLLIQLSQVLVHTCRESDCIIRWGGEEFLVVARFTERSDAALMAERIRSAIDNYVFILPDGTPLKKTCSIGYASYPFITHAPTALSWEQVVDIADSALYTAKNSGRNCYIGLSATTRIRHVDSKNGIHQFIPEMIDNGEIHITTSNKTAPIHSVT